MAKYENFLQLVQTDALYRCLSEPQRQLRPSSILVVAMQCPNHILNESPDDLKEQAVELVDWFFGGRDPSWLPEHLFYEEVEEEIEEYVEVDTGGYALPEDELERRGQDSYDGI